MKKCFFALSFLLIFNGGLSYAGTMADKTPAVSSYLKKITPEFLYEYSDFHFNSSAGTNYNNFKGHSNIYIAGADHIALGSSWMAGIYYFNVETALSSQILVSPNSLSASDQTINNNTIFAHAVKTFNPHLFADFSGGYGFNKFSTSLQNAPGSTSETDAVAKYNVNNWFLNINGIYRKEWKKFLIRGTLGVLYSQIDTPDYNFNFVATDSTQAVPELINKATLIIEELEVGYPVKPNIIPFLNGGLIEVAQYSNSRPILDTETINGSIPQINLNKNGFFVGGGITYTYKKLNMRLSEKYYNASGTFWSYNTLFTLEYQFEK